MKKKMSINKINMNKIYIIYIKERMAFSKKIFFSVVFVF